MSNSKMLDLSYATWKSLTQASGGPTWYKDAPGTNRKVVYSGSPDYPAKCFIGGADHTDWLSVFPSAIQVVDEDEAIAKILEASYGGLGAPITSHGYQKVEVEPREGSRFDSVSINWCDRTTWFPQSTLVSDETLSDSGDLTTYNSVSTNWIDMMHGKLTNERTLRAQYQPVVEVNDVAQTENTAGLTDGDYTIDYATGDVTFNSALTGGDVVTATYYKETGSCWKIAPAPGKLLRLTYVEVQFSENIDLTDTVIFEPYGPVEYYAPHLWTGYSPPGPYPTGTMIPLGSQTVYQTMQDFINEAEMAYPSVPKMGGTGWRGMKDAVHIFRWPYDSRGTTDITASSKIEIQIKLESNNSFGGDIAIATFYGQSKDE